MKSIRKNEDCQIEIYKFDNDKFFDFIKKQQQECAENPIAFYRNRLIELYYGVIFQGEGNRPIRINDVSKHNYSIILDIIKRLCDLDVSKQ